MIVLLMPSSTITYAQQEGNEITRTYGCQKYTDLIHCGPILNKLNSSQLEASFSKIYPSVRGDLQYTSGRYNGALEMHDGYREYLEVPITDSSVISSKFSVSFWIKTIADASPYGHVVSHVNAKQAAGWFFDVVTMPSSKTQDSHQLLRFIVSNNTGGIAGIDPSIPLSSSKFVNIIGTFDGSIVNIYRDGVLSGTSELRGNYSSNKEMALHIGSAAYCSACNRWAGIIDDLRLYNKALSAHEIRNIALNGTAQSNLDNLVIHLTFDNNVEDSSGNNNHGRMFTIIASMAYTPDGRLFFTEKNTGKIRIMKDDQILQKPFATITDDFVNWEQGLLGLAVDPDFTNNHFIYLYYTAVGNSDKSSDNPSNRVVRFTEKNNTGTEPVVLIDNIPASRGFHSGGGLAFGPDEKLYITVGDATEHVFAQDPSIPIGKILRINKDGTIPNDNPFPNSPVYTLGHRNMYGIAFDENGTIGIVAENGDRYYDEINLIRKGGNYGFPIFQPPNTAPELSNDSTSIKPLRSYWNAIGPTQTTYYTGDKFPALKGKFLFVTFSGDIYAVHINKKGKQIEDEIHINLQNEPNEPLTAIAQSPNGEIYFGGYNVYKLDSLVELGNESKQKILFPIEIDSSENIGIKNIDLSDVRQILTLDVSQSAKYDHDDIDTPEFLKMKIPTDLFNKIYKVTALTLNGSNSYQQLGKMLNFNVDNLTAGYNTISMQLPNNDDLRIIVNGTKLEKPVVKPTPTITAANVNSSISSSIPSLYDNFDENTYTLNDGELSPNGEWQNIYNGGGLSGVRKDLNGNNVFFMYPQPSISVNETHASLVKSIQLYENFELSAKVNTEKQLRQNSSPMPWEAAWILFRYTDEFHYYWFLVKPNGVELGKKDCDTCTEPHEGQIILYSVDTPTLSLGNQSKWDISAIGNRIMISINGTRIIDLLDRSMSERLRGGSIGLYSEDAEVSFDDIFIRPSSKDSHLNVSLVFSGLNFPSSMAFLGPNDILVLEKNQGVVKRIVNGKLLPEPLLRVPVANKAERGMLGIATSKYRDGHTYVFIYYTLSGGGVTGDDWNAVPPCCNVLYRYDFIDNKLINPKLLLSVPAGSLHNGGAIVLGPG
jgi:glucose/arabinose dehydrogenase